LTLSASCRVGKRRFLIKSATPTFFCVRISSSVSASQIILSGKRMDYIKHNTTTVMRNVNIVVILTRHHITRLCRDFRSFLSFSKETDVKCWADEVLKRSKRGETVLILLAAGIITAKRVQTMSKLFQALGNLLGKVKFQSLFHQGKGGLMRTKRQAPPSYCG
jgi:hypothetical protein